MKTHRTAKLFAPLLCLVMLLSLLPATADAATEVSPIPEGSTVVFEENFDLDPFVKDDKRPENLVWTQLDADEDGHIWEYRPGFNQHMEGDGLVCSFSYANASQQALTPDNWLISPKIKMPQASAKLSFAMVNQATHVPAEVVAVYAKVAGETEWKDQLGYYNLKDETTYYTLDLSAYAGKTIQLAFRHYNVTDRFAAVLDAIRVYVSHTHAPVLVPGQAPGCETPGWLDYYECSCGKYFADANGKTPIPDLDAWKAGAGKLEPVGHRPGEWQHDDMEHWKVCGVCGEKLEKAEHDWSGWEVVKEPTETEPGLERSVCSVCGAVDEYTLPPLQAFVIEIPFTLHVEQLGTMEPGEATFDFEAYGLERDDVERYALVDDSFDYEAMKDSLTVKEWKLTDKKGTVEGKLEMKVLGFRNIYYLSDGFCVKMAAGNAEGWTYAPETWFVVPDLYLEPMSLMALLPAPEIHQGPQVLGADVYAMKGDEISEALTEQMFFHVSYDQDKPVVPEKPDTPEKPDVPEKPATPETGDSSQTALWSVVAVAALTGAAGIVWVRRKREI